MGDSNSGNIDWNLNMDTGNSDAKIRKSREGIRSLTDEARKFHKASREGEESFSRGLEHGLHHTMRHLGMSGVMLGAGGGAFLASAGIDGMSKIAEAFERHMEEMKKQYEEGFKENAKETKASGGTQGMTAKTAFQLTQSAGAHFTLEEAATIGGKIKQTNPSIGNGALIAGINAVKDSQPAASGGEELVGMMSALGIPLDRLNALEEISGNRGKELAEALRKNAKRIKGNHYNASGYAKYVASALDSTDPEHAKRAIAKAGSADLDAEAKSLDGYQAWQNPNIEAFRANEEAETAIKQYQNKNASTDIESQKKILAARVAASMPQFWQGKRLEEFMTDERNVTDMDKYKYDLSHRPGMGYSQYNQESGMSEYVVDPKVLKVFNESAEASKEMAKASQSNAHAFQVDASQHQ